MPLPADRSRQPPRPARLACLLLGLLLVLQLGDLISPLALRAGAGIAAPPQASAPRPQEAEALRDSGSFRRGKVRILGIPVLTVASPVVAGSGGPDARQRARVIEGNLELLYRGQEVCTQAEAIGEMILDQLYLRSNQRACDSNQLGLLGDPSGLQVEVDSGSGGLPVLQARVPGREQPLPLLSVTAADARLNGTTPERLAERWRGLLEQRLRFARHLLEPGVLGLRFRTMGLVELALGGLVFLGLLLWKQVQHGQARIEAAAGPGVRWRRALPITGLHLLTRVLLGAVLLLLPLMAGVAVLTVPGQIPLAIDLLLQPFEVVSKLLLGWLLALLLRAVVAALLSQWHTNPVVSPERKARRSQRYQNLQRVARRLVDLACILLVSLWVVAAIPGVRELSSHVLLAGGALLGALALVFQDLLRDFVAGLVLLLEDRYAIGDRVSIDGLSGEVRDVNLLSTELRSSDQRVMVIPNSQCKRVVNTTKLRSGQELRLTLSHRLADPRAALAVIAQACEAFAADPAWAHELLEPPRLLGLREVTVEGLVVALLITTPAGHQAEVERELLLRLVEALRAAGIPLADAAEPARA